MKYDSEIKEILRLANGIKETVQLYFDMFLKASLSSAETNSLYEYLKDYTKGIEEELEKIDREDNLLLEFKEILKTIKQQAEESNDKGFDLEQLNSMSKKLYFKTKELNQFFGELLPFFNNSLIKLKNALEQIKEVQRDIQNLKGFENFDLGFDFEDPFKGM